MTRQCSRCKQNCADDSRLLCPYCVMPLAAAVPPAPAPATGAWSYPILVARRQPRTRSREETIARVKKKSYAAKFFRAFGHCLGVDEHGNKKEGK